MATIFDKVRIRNICKKYGIKNYIINSDCSISVNGSVDLSDIGLYKIPLNFKYVSGSFLCRSNNLKSLKGCPESVGGDFNCQRNKITTFEHLPLSIGGEFYCIDNPIWEIWKLFEDYSSIELFNYYDIIQDDVIILDRLICFLEEIRKEYYKRIIIDNFSKVIIEIDKSKSTQNELTPEVLCDTVTIDEFRRMMYYHIRRTNRKGDFHFRQ